MEQFPSSSRSGLPPFAAMRAFEAVFRVGGIRRAAAELRVSHAVVSRHLRTLESWLGTPIFERSGNRLVLTANGVDYHQRVSAAIAELSLATREICSRHDRGHLLLYCVPGLAIQWLSGQLAEFERERPEFSIELKPSDRLPNLVVHEADADIRYVLDEQNFQPAKGLRAFILSRPDVIAVANPEIAARANRLTSPADLLGETLLHVEHQGEWRSWLAANGVVVPDELPGLLCWHAHLAIDAAKLGRGIAVATRFLVDNDLKQSALEEVRIPGANPVVLGEYVLFAREDRWSFPPLVRLREFLRDQARKIAP